MGEKIYVFTQDFPIEEANLGIYEGCFAQVEERLPLNRNLREIDGENIFRQLEFSSRYSRSND